MFLLGSMAQAGTYDDNAELRALIEELVNQGHYTQDELTSLFSDVERKDTILEAIARPAEKTKTWKEYRAIFLGDDKRAREGVKFWNENADTLARAEAKYGVPAEMIVAIIGVETYYGRSKGKFRVIDALSTLAFDYPPRSAFFRKELNEFLVLAKAAHIDPATTTGSYAGAMGFPQFIPSSYRAYAVDFDDDGIIDLVNSKADAIGSVASYFRAHRWETGQPVATRAEIHGQIYDQVISDELKPTLDLYEIRKHGVEPVMCSDEISRFCLQTVNDSSKATAIKLFGDHGAEFWIGLPNFYVITRYNRSVLYAMAAFHLSQEIKSLKESP